MSILHVNHIKADCQKRFTGLVDVSDIHAATPHDVELHFLSRALAAFTIAALARVEDKEAADAVTDEQFDDGIDAFLYNPVEHTCYIVQSKWSGDGSGSIDVASVIKFCQGISHLLSGDSTPLGPKLRKKQQAISEVLGDSSATFVLVIAYTGKAALSNEVKKPIDELLSELNDDEDLVSVQVVRQQEAHKIVEQRALGASVDFDIMLSDFGKVKHPFTAYYGQMDVDDIANWSKFGDNLYARNIRGFKGSTDVNDAIINTLKNAPDHFVYFNNGINITCTSLTRKPLGTGGKSTGVFDCRGASVVNGAQTVGSIISFLAANPQPSNAKVMVRVTSLENCPSDFSSDITRAVNTQNRIERRDFAALDPTQSRIKSDMLLTFQKDYAFRTGDTPPQPENGCTLDEATVALACANKDLALSLTAKREVGRLYEDIHTAPYTILFNSSTSALVMWRAVQVLRNVDAFLRDAQAEGKKRLIAIHFNRLILHLVFRRIGALDVSETEWQHSISLLQTVTGELLTKTTDSVSSLFPGAYPGSLFKNATKTKKIVDSIMAPPVEPHNMELFTQ